MKNDVVSIALGILSVCAIWFAVNCFGLMIIDKPSGSLIIFSESMYSGLLIRAIVFFTPSFLARSAHITFSESSFIEAISKSEFCTPASSSIFTSSAFPSMLFISSLLINASLPVKFISITVISLFSFASCLVK